MVARKKDKHFKNEKDVKIVKEIKNYKPILIIPLPDQETYDSVIDKLESQNKNLSKALIELLEI